MAELKFNVFGKLVAIVGEPGRWSAFLPGSDGKRRPADFVVPDFLSEAELCQYLADVFHELATPANGTVVRLECGRCTPATSIPATRTQHGTDGKLSMRHRDV